MPNIALEEVESVLLEHKIKDTAAIINDLERIIEELKAEREAEKGPKTKNEFVVILNDPNKVLEGVNAEDELTAYVVTQEEGEDSNLILSKIADAAKSQNEVAKSKRTRLDTMKDIFEGLKSKFLKEKKIRIKTKEPVRILLSTGKF